MGAVTDGDPECGDGNYQHLSPRTGCHASLAEFALRAVRRPFLVGDGGFSQAFGRGVRGLNYGPPVATMRAYLKKMAEAPYTAVMPEAAPKTVIAALGPKMLELAASETAGAHPYSRRPITRRWREKSWARCVACPEQKVILNLILPKPGNSQGPSQAFIKTYPIIGTTGSGWG